MSETFEPGIHLHHGERLGGELELPGEHEPAAWSAPRTWVAGEVLTASLLNIHLRDQLLYLGGPDSRLSVPPVAPVDGQFWVYPADAGNAIYWGFKYVTSLAAWSFIGGPPLRAAGIMGSFSAAYTGTPYVDVSGGPGITLARAGTYTMKAGAAAFASAVSANVGYASIAPGTTATDADVIGVYGNAGPPGNNGFAAAYRLATVGAGGVLRVQHRNTVGGTSGIQTGHIHVEATPVRVT